MSSVVRTLPEEMRELVPPAETAASPNDDLPETVIERRPGWHFVNLREVWRYRELLFFLRGAT